MVTEELRTSGEGKSIYGYVTAPEGCKEKKLPTVIFSHGFGGNVGVGNRVAQALARQGYVVYSYDFVGGGSNAVAVAV